MARPFRPIILSLFPGIGLLDAAFEAEGFCVVRGPDVLWGGDVRRFHPPAGVFDGAIGGPPCQAFSSLAHLVRARGGEVRFGDLIPEFCRCVAEAAPAWFLMENVPRAPIPAVVGYAVSHCVWCNSAISGEDGLGQEQERKRRFSFGVRSGPAPDLRRWIQPPALMLPRRAATVAASWVDNSPEAKRRTRTRQRAVTTDLGTYLGPGGSQVRERVPPVSGHDGIPPVSHTVGRGSRRSLAEMLRLQGLPEDHLDDCPLTMEGKRRAVANGVPLPLGRAIARAVRRALDTTEE